MVSHMTIQDCETRTKTEQVIHYSQGGHPFHPGCVLRYIHNYQHVSFMELQRIFKIDGDQNLFWPKGMNIMVWSGLSIEFCDFLLEALRQKWIKFDESTPLLYLLDGGGLTLPTIGKRPPKNGYKTERWLPVVLNSGKNFNKAFKRKEKE